MHSVFRGSQRAEPPLPVAATCSPAASQLLHPRSASRDHLPHKLLAPKSSPQFCFQGPSRGSTTHRVTMSPQICPTDPPQALSGASTTCSRASCRDPQPRPKPQPQNRPRAAAAISPERPSPGAAPPSNPVDNRRGGVTQVQAHHGACGDGSSSRCKPPG